MLLDSGLSSEQTDFAETKVRQFQVAVTVDQKIVRLEITMYIVSSDYIFVIERCLTDARRRGSEDALAQAQPQQCNFAPSLLPDIPEP